MRSSPQPLLRPAPRSSAAIAERLRLTSGSVSGSVYCQPDRTGPLWLLRRGVRQGMKGRDVDRTILIREAAHEDAPQIAELLSELGYPLSASEAGVRLARSSETVFVAADGPSLVGLLAISSQFPIARPRPVARITAMIVRSGARRRRLGTALMERAVEWARSAGCEGIELTSGIRPEREGAHRFYERCGFVKTSYRFWLPFTDHRGPVLDSGWPSSN